MIKIGGISLTQTPTTDIRRDILSILGGGFELLEAGALDGLTKEEILALAPRQGEGALTDRLEDGTVVVCKETAITPQIQNCITNLEEQGVEAIVLYCGGDFSGLFQTRVQVIYPLLLMNGIVPALTSKDQVAIMTPLPSQASEAVRKWQKYIKEPLPIIGSPHDGIEVVKRLAEEVRDLDVDLAVLDCFGFSITMKEEFQRISGKRCVASRTLAARMIAEMFA